ncbi:MAG: hypothetical protein QM692_17165 [Thermomicrobiales bacterium]
MRPGQLPAEWSEDERQRFMRDRERRLAKLVNDRQSWQRTLAQLDGCGLLEVTWTNHDGQEQVMLLTPAFMAGHTRALSATTAELISCGDDGLRRANDLFDILTTSYHRPVEAEEFGA